MYIATMEVVEFVQFLYASDNTIAVVCSNINNYRDVVFNHQQLS